MYQLTYLFFCVIVVDLSFKKGISANDCLGTKNYFSNHLGTKTAYRFVSNNNDTVLSFYGCEPKKLWMVIRHGSRYPSKNVIERMTKRMPVLCTEIINNHNFNNGELCSGSLSNLSSWLPQVHIDDNKRLVHEGEDEMLELAERFQNRFPEILPEEYSNSTYKFRFTATQRTMESKRYFTIGLFGRRVSRYVWTPDPLHKDPILRFYKLCPKWQSKVKKNPNSLFEKVQFEKTEYMRSAIRNVSRRLGFSSDLPLEDVHLMYITCAFESAWRRSHISPWCTLFTQHELEVLEYADDLKYYWIDGYGHRLNYLQACPILRDMIHHLTSEREPTSTFYFTHSGTLLKVLAHLGLYKDEEKLTHQTFDRDRLWKAGRIDAFGTNLAFVLYGCEDGLKVLTLHQERPVLLPGCREELCPLSHVIKTYYDTFYDCKFSDICDFDE